ncbi:MAG TPA: hypothetical protein VIL46_11985, partial [Gemmataceae bacterium]
MRIALAWLCGLLVLAACGCRGRSDLVEAELRTREREIGQLRAELQRARAINEALERELGSAPPFPHGELSAHAPGSPLLVGSLEK